MANEKAVSDEEIIAALLSSCSMKQAAAAAGIAPRTLYERMGNKDFLAAYRAAKSDIVRAAIFAINNKLAAAIDVVAAIMEDENNNASIRLQAAQVIINNAGKFADRLTKDEEYTLQKTNGYSYDM